MPEPTTPDGYEITPSAIPKTREHALALASAWGSTLSHTNEFMNVETWDGDQPRRTATLAHIAEADAAEVVRLCALAGVLPSEFDDVVDAEVVDGPEALVPILADLVAAPSGAGSAVLYVPRRVLDGWREQGFEPVLSAKFVAIDGGGA